MNNACRQSLHVVRNKSDQTQASHCAAELNIVKLTLQLLLWLHVEQLLRILCRLFTTLRIRDLLELTYHVDELAVAIVD